MKENSLAKNLHIYITFYVNPHAKKSYINTRAGYLANSILSIAYLKSKSIDLKLFTNDRKFDFRGIMRPLESSENTDSKWEIYFPESKEDDIKIRQNPWLLTWQHKTILKKDVEKYGKNSLYICMEDDAILSQANLDYFLNESSNLQKYELIPSFVRAEWQLNHMTWVNPDHFVKFDQKRDIVIQEEKRIYVQLENPYCALIMLNQELAEEYVNSESFQLDKAVGKHKIIWDTGATASLGLIAEKIPIGMKSRVAVAYSKESKVPLIGAVIRHQGDKYANDPWQLQFPLFDQGEEDLIPRLRKNIIKSIPRIRYNARAIILKRIRNYFKFIQSSKINTNEKD